MAEATHLVDLDEEKLVRHFCLEQECKEVVEWFKKEGHSRPDDFHGRLSLAAKLREEGNKRFQEEKLEAAMMCALSAMHCLDFSRGASVMHTDAQKQQVFESLVKILSNMSIVFLKRGDNYNATRAADLGLDYAKRLSQQDVGPLKAKLLYRRGLAKGQSKDFPEAKESLTEAAKLMPGDQDIRKALENCKILIQRDRGEPDDKWRGKMTDSPEVAVRRAQLRRCWRNTKAMTLEIWFLLRRPETIRTVVLMFMGPLLSFLGLHLVRRWADNRMPGGGLI